MPDDNLNFVPALNSTALPKQDTDNVNYYPALNPQQILDGQYLQFGSTPNRSLREFPSVDKTYVAGEDINAGQAVGLWGYITVTSAFLTAAQATWVYNNDPEFNTNYDGTELETNASTKHGLLSWSTMPTIPSATGLTILTIKVTFKYDVPSGSPDDMDFDINTATFTEGTVTWNTGKPANGGEGTGYGFSAGSGVKTGSKLTLTSTQYNNLKANGLTSHCTGASAANISDEDASTPPQVQVEFIYEIQDGDVYLASGLATKYADAFRGIAQNDAVLGQDVVLRQEGIDDNHLTGLTAFSDYQLSDTPGTIQTGTSATSDKVVGNARSATSFHIKYVLNDAT